MLNKSFQLKQKIISSFYNKSKINNKLINNNNNNNNFIIMVEIIFSIKKCGSNPMLNRIKINKNNNNEILLNEFLMF